MSLKSQYDPGVIMTEKGFYTTLFRLFDMDRQVCIPAIVKEYDRDSHMAKVVPIVKDVYDDDIEGKVLVDRPTVSVRVMLNYHGGFLVDAPIYKNDIGIIIACDRPFSYAASLNSNQPLEDGNYLDGDNKGPQEPDIGDILKFENGIFIPFALSKPSFSGYEDALIVLKRDAAGNEMKVTLETGKAKIERTDVANEITESITFSEDGISYEGTPDRTQDVITAIRYDSSSHQIQTKTVTHGIRGTFPVTVSEESDWKMISGGQAVKES